MPVACDDAVMSETASPGEPEVIPPERAGAAGDLVTCDACPVLCRIRPGRTGACDRYGNVDGKLARMDPMVLARQTIDQEGRLVPFLAGPEWDGGIAPPEPVFVTGIGSG